MPGQGLEAAPPSPAKHKVAKLARKLQGVCSAAAAEHQDSLARAIPVLSTQMAMVLAAGIRLSVDLVTAAAFSDASDKRTPPSPPQAPGPSKKAKARCLALLDPLPSSPHMTPLPKDLTPLLTPH